MTELAPEDPDAWCALGWAAQAAGRRQEAGVAYEKYLEDRSEDAPIRHLLTALKDEAPPPRASNECIVQMFREFSLL